MKQKKLMLLGGLRYLIPVIEAAHKEGLYVITCDYKPDNIAHKYSDEFCNISIVDKEAVLAKAKELEIDGIMSFAVDPGVETAAYVAEQMKLPFTGSYESIRILQNKDLFRKFLSQNGFNVPVAAGFNTLEDAKKEFGSFTLPVIVKPTDSAGSKGVTKITSVKELDKAFNHAKDNSTSGRVIIEEFIEKEGCSSDSDCFLKDGNFAVMTFSAQRFDEDASNPFAPSGYSWPSTFTGTQENYLSSELQRLINLLNLKTGIFNIETRIGQNGKPYIMEVSPRGGGNRLAEMIRFGTGVDMITAYVHAAIGEDIGDLKQRSFDGHWAEIILHSKSNGVFSSLEISEPYKNYVHQIDLWVEPGDKINIFNGANDAIGTLVMCFPSSEILDKAMATVYDWCRIKLCNIGEKLK